MSESQKNPPINATKSVTLSTGKQVFFKDPTMRDQRIASARSVDANGKQAENILVEEWLKLLIVQVRRANGEIIDITNIERIFDDVFTFHESLQLFSCALDVVRGGKEEAPLEVPKVNFIGT